MGNPDNFETPVLFIIFNRPDVTQLVFDAIKRQKPSKLFVSADGPRLDRDEKELCDYTRDIIKQVDWECDLHTLFRTNNLGCKAAIRGAMDWFFSFVEEGIILEDDCLPDDSFFSFCELMLTKYRNSGNVKIVSGTNYFFGKFNKENSYCFLPFTFIWGWATWKNRWEEVSFDCKTYDPIKFRNKLKEICSGSGKIEDYWFNMVDATMNGTQDAWSPFLFYSTVNLDGLSVVPTRNLIYNMGEQSSRIDVLLHKQIRKYTSVRMPLYSIDISSIVHPVNVSIAQKKLKLTIKGLNRCLFGELYFLPLFFRKLLLETNKFTDIFWIGRQIQRILLPYFPFLKLKEIPKGKLEKYAKKVGVKRTKNRAESIAIIIPCYRHAKFLRKCLESVIKQIILPDMLIIVNDASPDHTQNIVSDFKKDNPGLDVLYIHNSENIGQAACINKAIASSDTDLYMILNDDDYLLPDAVKLQLHVFRNNANIHLFGATGFIVTDNLQIDSLLLLSGKTEPVIRFHSSEECWLYKNFDDLNMMHTSSAFTRIAWEHIGGYFSDKTKRIVPFSDRDFQLRLNACFLVGIDNKLPLAFWRSNSSVDSGFNS